MARTGAAGNDGAGNDGAPAPLSGAPRRAGRRRPRPAITAAFGAGITASVLAGALMAAAGPAAAVAHTGAAARAHTTASSPARPAAARLRSLAAPGVLPWTRRAATGTRAMTPQASVASASSTGFHGAALYGVSCTGRKQCTATGMASTRSGKNLKPLAERWDGSTWAGQTTPTTDSGGYLGAALDAGVSCTSSSACMAAGYSYTAKTSQLLGEGWNGRSWSIQPDSKPAVGGEAFRIACTWAKDCTAVGIRTTGDTLAEHWNGKNWSAETTKHTGEYDGVTCPATGNCTAVGMNDAGKALAAHWNGKAWSDESPADPQPFTLLEDIACPASTACVAVGAAGTLSSTTVATAPLAEQWTGSAWTNLTVPDPGASGDIVELNSVSCTSATSCMAVGDDENAAGTADTPLAAQWDGSGWTFVSAPSVSTFSALFSVSCTSASFCSAVGASSPTASGTVSPVAETWNGSTWSLQTAAG